MTGGRFGERPWTASRAVGGAAAVLALALALGPAYPYTLGLTMLIGLFAIVVALALPQQTAIHEFLTSFTLPVFGLLVALTPAVAVYETHGILLDPGAIAGTVAIGITAAIAAATVFPVAAGGFRPSLPRLTLALSGQLFVPLGFVVFMVYMFQQQRVLEAAPSPEAFYRLLVVEPAASGDIAPLVVTSSLLWILIGLIGILLSRPLEYGWLYPEEPEGRFLEQLSFFFYGLAFLVVLVGWLGGFLVLLATRPEVSYPAAVWLILDGFSAVAENRDFVRLVVNMLIVYAGAALLVSPLYIVRWVERTNTLWLIRHVFSAALALLVGLAAAVLTRRAIFASRTTIEAMDAAGDLAWTAFDWLPVIFTGLPFVGTVVIFTGSVIYVYLFEYGVGSYSLYVAYRNVGVGALFFVAALTVAGATPTVFGLAAAGAALVAWDTFEFGYTLRVELPGVGGVAANELVHSAGIAGVALGSVVVALLANALVSPLAVERDGMLLAAFLLLVGGVVLLFALRE